MILRRFTESFFLSATELASEFCELGVEEQVEFFNTIATLTKNWKEPFSYQMDLVIISDTLTDDAKKIMNKIYYSADRAEEVKELIECSKFQR